MAYVPTEWKTGDIVTAAKLNKLEEAVANASGGGGSGLPAVTSDDNGDVLAVVEGAWAKAAPSSWVLVVTVTGSDDNYISDTTFSQIRTAITNGEFVVCRHSDDEGSYGYFNLSECYLSDNPEEAEYEYAVFSKTGTTNAVSTSYYTISHDDSVTFESAVYPSN